MGIRVVLLPASPSGLVFSLAQASKRTPQLRPSAIEPQTLAAITGAPQTRVGSGSGTGAGDKTGTGQLQDSRQHVQPSRLVATFLYYLFSRLISTSRHLAWITWCDYEQPDCRHSPRARANTPLRELSTSAPSTTRPGCNNNGVPDGFGAAFPIILLCH